MTRTTGVFPNPTPITNRSPQSSSIRESSVVVGEGWRQHELFIRLGSFGDISLKEKDYFYIALRKVLLETDTETAIKCIKSILFRTPDFPRHDPIFLSTLSELKKNTTSNLWLFGQDVPRSLVMIMAAVFIKNLIEKEIAEKLTSIQRLGFSIENFTAIYEIISSLFSKIFLEENGKLSVQEFSNWCKEYFSFIPKNSRKICNEIIYNDDKKIIIFKNKYELPLSRITRSIRLPFSLFQCFTDKILSHLCSFFSAKELYQLMTLGISIPMHCRMQSRRILMDYIFSKEDPDLLPSALFPHRRSLMVLHHWEVWNQDIPEARNHKTNYQDYGRKRGHVNLAKPSIPISPQEEKIWKSLCSLNWLSPEEMISLLQNISNTGSFIWGYQHQSLPYEILLTSIVLLAELKKRSTREQTSELESQINILWKWQKSVWSLQCEDAYQHFFHFLYKIYKQGIKADKFEELLKNKKFNEEFNEKSSKYLFEKEVDFSQFNFWLEKIQANLHERRLTVSSAPFTAPTPQTVSTSTIRTNTNSGLPSTSSSTHQVEKKPPPYSKLEELGWQKNLKKKKGKEKEKPMKMFDKRQQE